MDDRGGRYDRGSDRYSRDRYDDRRGGRYDRDDRRDRYDDRWVAQRTRLMVGTFVLVVTMTIRTVVEAGVMMIAGGLQGERSFGFV